MSKRLAFLVCPASVVFFGCFFIWPIWIVIKGGIFDADRHFTFGYIRSVFQNPIYIEGLWNSFIIGVCTTILTTVIALILACLYVNFKFKFKKFLSTIILLPIILPPFVGANGFMQLLGTYGTINQLLIKCGLMDSGNPVDWIGMSPMLSIIFISSFSLYPILYLNIITALSNIDSTLIEAAENVGCSLFRKFTKIIFPLIRQGIFAGCTIVFIWAFTELGIPLMLNFNRVTSVQIYHGLREIGSSPFPYALVSVMFVFSAAIYLFGKFSFGRINFPTISKSANENSCKQLPFYLQACCILVFVFVAIISLLPHLIVILFSFASDWYQSVMPSSFTIDNYYAAIGNSITIPAIKNNLIYAFGATIISILLGTGIAFVVTRSNIHGKQMLDTCAMMPLAVPSLVVAFGLMAMSQEGRAFEFLNPIKNPTALLIIAYAIRRIPLIVRTASAGLQQVSVTYEEAAQSMGCSSFKSIFKITIPLIFANIISGGILVFSQSMLEVSDSLILAQKRAYYPITKAIYELLNFIGDGTFLSCALGVWTMMFLTMIIFAAIIFLRKNLGSLFKT